MGSSEVARRATSPDPLNPPKKEKKQEKPRNIKKWVFQLSVKFFFFGGCPNVFLTTWPKERAPQKTL